jgi:xylulokinase
VVGRKAVLGVDLGTSSVKALVAGLDGSVLGRGAAGYAVRVPGPGLAESDPEDWWRAAVTAVRAALAEAGDADVGAVGLAGQMHGVVLAGADGDVVRPAILWLDQRAAAEAEAYERLPAELTAPLGNRASAGMAGPLLCWLGKQEPSVLRGARWSLQPKDWLRLRLTGQAATDPTDASGTLLFDVAARTWTAGLIDALGLPAEKLPPVRDSAEAAGELLPRPAAEFGLRPGIPVACGAGDTAAALYAAGLGTDEAMLTLGSGGQWVVPERNPAGPPRPRSRPAAGTNLYLAVGGGCYRLAPVQNVGVTLNWVRTLLGMSWDEMYATAARPRCPEPPVFEPYLTPERWDPSATGAWTGLTLAHRREDLARAALDGVAGLLRQRLEDLRAAGAAPRRVVLGGGGTDHIAWRALLADALALPVRPAPASTLTVAGAARLACDTLGVLPLTTFSSVECSLARIKLFERNVRNIPVNHVRTRPGTPALFL